MNQRFKQLQKEQQQQALMQQVMLQQQQLYHSGVLAAAISQMEPVPSGNLPPGFDPSTCCSVYIGNIHPNVAECLLAEVFQSIDPFEGCKLIRKRRFYCSLHLDLLITTIGGRQLLQSRHCMGASYHPLQIRPSNQGELGICERSKGRYFWMLSAINDLSGKWLGSRQIRCNWAKLRIQEKISKAVIIRMQLY